MPQGLLKRFEVLKKYRNKFDCLMYRNAFYKSFKAKSQRTIRLHSGESIFMIFALFDVNPFMIIFRAKIALNAVICIILYIFTLIMES